MPLLLDLVQLTCLSCLNVRVFKNRRRTVSPNVYVLILSGSCTVWQICVSLTATRGARLELGFSESASGTSEVLERSQFNVHLKLSIPPPTCYFDPKPQNPKSACSDPRKRKYNVG